MSMRSSLDSGIGSFLARRSLRNLWNPFIYLNLANTSLTSFTVNWVTSAISYLIYLFNLVSSFFSLSVMAEQILSWPSNALNSTSSPHKSILKLDFYSRPFFTRSWKSCSEKLSFDSIILMSSWNAFLSLSAFLSSIDLTPLNGI